MGGYQTTIWDPGVITLPWLYYRTVGLSYRHGDLDNEYNIGKRVMRDQSYVPPWKVDIYLIGIFWRILFLDTLAVYPCYCRIEEMLSRQQLREIHVTSETTN